MGDDFVRHPDGSLDFVDRRKYLIKSGGENIYPAEIERLVMESDRVEEGRLDREADRIHLLYVEKMECLEDLVTGRETLRTSTLRINSDADL